MDKWKSRPARIITRSNTEPIDARDGDIWLKSSQPIDIVQARDKIDALLDILQTVALVMAGVGIVAAVLTR